MAKGPDARARRVLKSSLEDSLKTKIEEISALYQVSRTIISSMNLRRMLNLIARQVMRVMHCRICAMHIIEGGHLILKASCGITKEYADLRDDLQLRHNLFGLAVLKKRSYIIKDLKRYSKQVPFHAAKTGALRSLLLVPLIEKERALGVLSVFDQSVDAFTSEDAEELKLFASQVAVAIENAKLFEDAKQNYLNVMKLLASVIDAKDSYTEDHSEKVAKYALGISKELDLDDRVKDTIKYASFLHDIGKINIDASILQKPGPLTKEEWAKMREHPRTASRIISRAGFLDELIPIILYHHVRYSGGGYPTCNKKGDDIPVGSRILAVADAYEAMTSDRPYRRGMTKREAFRELKRCAGTQFDPKVVNAFLKFLTHSAAYKPRTLGRGKAAPLRVTLSKSRPSGRGAPKG
jgi:HD-GYP domain-containing protein (c-di-GMP phosphodiesterase class II)